MDKVCEYCKNAYNAECNTRRFCCYECYWSFKKSKRQFIYCLVCNNKYYRRNISNKEWSNRKFCCKKCFHKYMRGDKTYQWKGGITKLAEAIRKDFKYNKWRVGVFLRDERKCQITGNKGIIVAHHIKNFKNIIDDNNIKNIEDARKCESFWNIDNGITMLKNVHEEFHKIYTKYNNTYEQIIKFKEIYNGKTNRNKRKK